MTSFFSVLNTLLVLHFLASCASNESKTDRLEDPQTGRSESEDISESPKGQADSDEDSGAGIDISRSTSLLVVSLSNNPETSKTIDRDKAIKFAKELESQMRGKKRKLRYPAHALVSSRRLSSLGLSDVMLAAKTYMDSELRENSKAVPPDDIILEIVLAAFMEKRYSMVEHFLPLLFNSKAPQIKAAAFNLQGLLQQKEGRLPEAAASWEEALKLRQGYQPAALNLGITALRFGDFERANKLLNQVPDDWFVGTHLVAAERLTGRVATARDICGRILSKKPQNKLGLFNCAVNEFQTYQNYPKAKEYLAQSIKIRSLDSTIDERAYVLLEKIDLEIAKKKSSSPAADSPEPSSASKEPSPAQVKEDL